jgi:ubiquitin thioesterase ZRANB1
MSNPIDDDDDSSFDDIEHRDENVERNSSNTMATTTLIDDKWSCSVCTYLNFAVAQKCTMCRQPKTTTMNTASADIYQLNASSESNTHQEQAQQQILATYIDSVEKWPCDQCTFLNYPRAVRCTQCGSYRLIGISRVSPVQPPVDTNTTERISPPPSITDARLIAQRLRKWTCTRCTTDSKLKKEKNVLENKIRGQNFINIKVT